MMKNNVAGMGLKKQNNSIANINVNDMMMCFNLNIFIQNDYSYLFYC